MTLDALLARLEACGASLRFEGDRVYLRNAAALTPEDRELLRDHRDALRLLVTIRGRMAKEAKAAAKAKAAADAEAEENALHVDERTGRRRPYRRLDRLKWAWRTMHYMDYIADGGVTGSDLLAAQPLMQSDSEAPAAARYVPVADRPQVPRRRFGDAVEPSFRRNTR